jgi:hypothetical protein
MKRKKLPYHDGSIQFPLELLETARKELDLQPRPSRNTNIEERIMNQNTTKEHTHENNP